jgi:hypothetical protein
MVRQGFTRKCWSEFLCLGGYLAPPRRVGGFVPRDAGTWQCLVLIDLRLRFYLLFGDDHILSAPPALPPPAIFFGFERARRYG